MLENKVAIVTGGSKGMGRHFVDALVAAGARVASFARSSAENTALEKEYGANAAIACDVSDPDQVNAAVAETIARFGRIDALINNAAIFDLFRLENATDAQIRASVEINLLGPLWCIRAATPHLCETRGHILSISSESVRMPFPYLSVYAATKAAVETLGTAMRDELRDKGVRVTTLRSGPGIDGPRGRVGALHAGGHQRRFPGGAGERTHARGFGGSDPPAGRACSRGRSGGLTSHGPW